MTTFASMLSAFLPTSASQRHKEVLGTDPAFEWFGLGNAGNYGEAFRKIAEHEMTLAHGETCEKKRRELIESAAINFERAAAYGVVTHDWSI